MSWIREVAAVMGMASVEVSREMQAASKGVADSDLTGRPASRLDHAIWQQMHRCMFPGMVLGG